jgi:hypothetical protein
VTATKTAGTFRQSCSVSCTIAAPVARVWGLLTDAKRFPSWNSTVTSIDGDIALGQRLAIKVPGVDRTFHPKVTKLVPREMMAWSDGFAPMFRGVRTFTLAPQGAHTTEFTMTETFSGLMLPMIRRSLPDFAPQFDAYAADLKRTAESAS